jgi:hypothetical protein
MKIDFLQQHYWWNQPLFRNNHDVVAFEASPIINHVALSSSSFISNLLSTTMNDKNNNHIPSLPSSSSMYEIVTLFQYGAIIGPMVDSLHNQSLLRYSFLPIHLGQSICSSTTTSNIIFETFLCRQHEYILSSSWIIPPLLGVTYVVLGHYMPQVIDTILLLFGSLLSSSSPTKKKENQSDDIGLLFDYDDDKKNRNANKPDNDVAIDLVQQQRTNGEGKDNNRATTTIRYQMNQFQTIGAILTTVMIILLSDYFIMNTSQSYTTSSRMGLDSKLFLLSIAVFFQWILLDQTLSCLLIGLFAAYFGPLCEIPFIGVGCWSYLDQVIDYIPFQHLFHSLSVTTIMNDSSSTSSSSSSSSDWQNIGLAHITGPCYFAVTLDAIALNRYFTLQRYHHHHHHER